MAHRFGKGLIANFAAFVLMERLAHGEMLLERREWDAAQIAPCPEYPVEVDVDNHIT